MTSIPNIQTQAINPAAKDTPLLVFIHGAGENGTIWDRQAQYFRDRWRVHQIDLPGHGRSGGKGRKEISAYAHWVRGLIAQSFAGKTLVLAGHSMGGAITLDLALDTPAEVKGLVLIGTGAKLGVAPTILEMLAKDPESFFQSIDIAAFDPETPAEIRQPVITAIRQCDPAVILDDFGACDRFDVRARLKDIHLPALILCGKRDKLTPVKYSHYLHEHITGSELALFDRAGHMVMAEQAEPVNQAIDKFMQKGIFNH